MYEDCRRLGHAWEELGDAPLGYEATHRSIWLRCLRCSMLRAFDILPNGQTAWPRYFPPTGYYYEGDRGTAPTKADYRVGWLREILAKRKASR